VACATGAGAACDNSDGMDTTDRGTVKTKLLPLPSWLDTAMSPPIRRARLREISSPSPVPPKRLERDSSP